MSANNPELKPEKKIVHTSTRGTLYNIPPGDAPGFAQNGLRKITWASKHMPIVSQIVAEYKDGQPLEEGEYYIADLIGCIVKDEDGNQLGTVRDVLQTGANDVYVVGCGVPDAKGMREKEILLPVIKDCIKQVDIEKGEILVHILPGLLD